MKNSDLGLGGGAINEENGQGRRLALECQALKGRLWCQRHGGQLHFVAVEDR